MPNPARPLMGAILLIVVMLSACSSSGSKEATPTPRSSTTTSAPEPSTAPAGPSGGSCDTPPTTVSGPAGQSTLVSDARFATALAWAPDGRLFFAERAGTIKSVTGSSVKEFTTVPTVTSERDGSYSERGLLGLALSPNFATDHFVYAFYSRNDYTTQVVVRFTDCAGVATDETTLVTLPSGDDCCHKGGRLAFGKDGKLYVTLGDEHSVDEDTVGTASSVPQDISDVRGKVLRYEPDGSIPSDNPFGADTAVWVAGLRNPFGIAFDTRRRRLRHVERSDRRHRHAGHWIRPRVPRRAGRSVPVACVLRLLTSRAGRDHLPRFAGTGVEQRGVDDRANRRNVGRRERS